MKYPFQAAVLFAATTFASFPLVQPPSFAIAAPKQAPCAVCSVKEGAGPEAVRATAKHAGKEYTFCRAECKQEFLKKPSVFLKAEAPRPAPAFALKNLNGKTVTLADYKGKVVLLDFWATFCAPCVKVMPQLQKLNDKHAAQGFAMVGIATDTEGAAKVAPFLAKHKITYSNLLGDASAWEPYGVESLPTMFLINREGQIVKRFGGNTDHKTVEREVEKLIGGEAK